MQKRFVILAALGMIFAFAGGALILVKPRQKAVAEQKAAQATIDALTSNAGARRADARTLKADSEASIRANDYESAMSERVKMLERNKTRISNLGALSFYAIQSSALDDVGRIATHLDAPALRRFADQLEAQDARLFTLTQILVNQKAEELKQVSDIDNKDAGEWNKTMQELKYSVAEKAELKRTPVARVKANIAAFYDGAIAGAKQPYSPTITKPRMVLDPYSKTYATAYVADRFLWTRAKTQRVLTIFALRARADRLEKNAPNAPLPLDPFGTGTLQSKAGVIYSTGPDGVDNGGRFMPTRYQVGAKGDVLAPTF